MAPARSSRLPFLGPLVSLPVCSAQASASVNVETGVTA
jgi:hypothetical protein